MYAVIDMNYIDEAYALEMSPDRYPTREAAEKVRKACAENGWLDWPIVVEVEA